MDTDKHRCGETRISNAERLTLKARGVNVGMVRRHQVVVVLSGLLLVYVISWHFRGELGLAHPMANMMYYHYGSRPNAWTDSALYWFYYPASLFGDRLGIYWKNRAGGYDISDF